MPPSQQHVMTGAFTNPGTADHVFEELREAHENLSNQRSLLTEKFEQQRSEFEAVHKDITDRIEMVEAALNYHHKKKPQEGAVDPEMDSGYRQMGRI